MHEKQAAHEARTAAAPRRAASHMHRTNNPSLPPQFEYVHIDLGDDKPPWFKAEISPQFGTVPAVMDHGRGVFESAIIVEYLQDKFPDRGTHLLPGGAP